MRLQNEVALVTGSTKGIGRATAMRFAAEGAKVVVTGRSVDAGREVEQAIGEHGGEALFVPMDVAKEDDVVHALQAARERFGKLTVLVNNAAPTDDATGTGMSDGAFGDISLSAWQRFFSIQVDGTFLACKHAIPLMLDAGYGSIVNISSVAAVLGTRGLAAYSAAKAALHAMTRSVAVDYAPTVRANAIVVGMVLSNERQFTAARHPVMGPALEQVYITGLGLPEDIAAAALFLASREARFVTGAILPVDGGATCKLTIPTVEAGLWEPDAPVEIS